MTDIPLTPLTCVGDFDVQTYVTLYTVTYVTPTLTYSLLQKVLRCRQFYSNVAAK